MHMHTWSILTQKFDRISEANGRRLIFAKGAETCA